MAKLIRANGTTAEIKEKLTLEVMQKLVGGYIEIVHSLDRKHIFICDEEGLLKNYPVNVTASLLGRKEKAIYNDVFCGDIIYADRNEVD